MSSNATAGPEIQVNTTTTMGQSAPAIASLADGGWVVTWTSYNHDGSGFGIYQQRFTADGTTLDTETQVNTYATDDQSDVSVAGLAGGGWVVTWTSVGQDGSGTGVYQQQYAADGTAYGETPVNTYKTDNQSTASVAALVDGGWVVTWSSKDQDGSDYGVYQQRYTAGGATDGSETLVNTSTSGFQGDSQVTALADGGWVVTWASDKQDGSLSGTDIYQQRYNASGLTDGSETVVDNFFDYQYLPSVAALTDGGWVVSWTADKNIRQKHFDADGGAHGDEGVATYSVEQEYSAIAALADGGWVVTWLSMEQDGRPFGIYQQRYAADGTQSGSETLVNPTTDQKELGASVTGLADGSWVVTWTFVGSDGSAEIHSRHFAKDIVGTKTADELVGTSWDESIFGKAGNDRLDGGLGSDRLAGGTGKDRLTGSDGSDTFVFGTALNKSNVDTITDFSHILDTLEIDNAVYKGLKVGDLAKADFTRISSAKSNVGVDRSDHILYDKKNGDLYFDRDGSGHKYDRVLFAHVTDNTALDHTDFLLV